MGFSVSERIVLQYLSTMDVDAMVFWSNGEFMRRGILEPTSWSKCSVEAPSELGASTSSAFHHSESGLV